jgi:hypothetical protein
MSDAIPLTPEQQLEAQQYAALFLQLAQREAQRFGELIATRPDTQLLGRTEFDLRTLVHRLGATFLETALEERKKGATSGPVSSAPTAPRTPS